VTSRGDAYLSSSVQRGQQRQVVTINIAQLVSGAEAQLQLDRKTPDQPATDPAGNKAAARILEMPSFEVRLGRQSVSIV
jgi:hypothetical protein